MEKIIQLYQVMKTRHSAMVVGATGAGKTITINAFIKAQNYLGYITKCILVNPKVKKKN